MNDRSFLANDDAPRRYLFTAETLDAQMFRVTVASVDAAAAAFFMCHSVSLIFEKKNCPGRNAGPLTP
jgi:hypothetical protein